MSLIRLGENNDAVYYDDKVMMKLNNYEGAAKVLAKAQEKPKKRKSMTKMNNAGESSNDCEDGHSDVTRKTTNTRQDQTPVTKCITGGSTGEIQADTGQDDTYICRRKTFYRER